MTVDFGKTAQDYGRYRAGFPQELFVRLKRFGVGEPGQKVLDVGTGTGALARGFARQGCLVTGLDKSPQLINQAKELDAAASVHVDYVISQAEQTNLPDSSFDIVTAGQCWHWFDRPRAASEARRLLVPNGRLVITNFDWIRSPGDVADVTLSLITKFNPNCNDLGWDLTGGTGVYGIWLGDLVQAGFKDIETFSFDVQVPYTHEAWRGRIRASAGVAATLQPGVVAEFDAELQKILARDFPADPLEIRHRSFAVVSTRPS